jgi:hypothetical protein
MHEDSAPFQPERDQTPPAAPITPEILEWARRQFSEEQIAAALREFEATGGLELKDFIHELEAIVDADG